MRTLTPPEIQPAVRIVNYFDVRPGSFWGPRVIPDLELILILRGKFLFERDDGVSIALEARDVLCILPNKRHTFRHVGGKGRISCIHCELVPDGLWAAGGYRLEPEPAVRTAQADTDDKLSPLFREAARVFRNYSRHRDSILQALVRAIWLRLAESWDPHAASRLTPRVEKMLQYLREHLAEPLSRQDLARVFSLTPQHINVLFRNELGISPTQLLHRERVLKAHHWIQNEGLSLKEAAARAGFNDVFYFSRVFKKVTGLRPSQIR